MKLQALVRQLLSENDLSPDDCRVAFCQFDTDGNGLIDATEFTYFVTQVLGLQLKKAELRDLWKMLDVNLSGAINFVEFTSAIYPHSDTNLVSGTSGASFTCKANLQAASSCLGGGARSLSRGTHVVPGADPSHNGGADMDGRPVTQMAVIQSQIRTMQTTMQAHSQASAERSKRIEEMLALQPRVDVGTTALGAHQRSFLGSEPRIGGTPDGQNTSSSREHKPAGVGNDELGTDAFARYLVEDCAVSLSQAQVRRIFHILTDGGGSATLRAADADRIAAVLHVAMPPADGQPLRRLDDETNLSEAVASAISSAVDAALPKVASALTASMGQQREARRKHRERPQARPSAGAAGPTSSLGAHTGGANACDGQPSDGDDVAPRAEAQRSAPSPFMTGSGCSASRRMHSSLDA